MLAEGRVSQVRLVDGRRAAMISDAARLAPAPGQYTLAHASGSDDPLATPLFMAKSDGREWLCAPTVPADWQPETKLSMRGPLGRGFHLDKSARRVAVIAPEGDSSRLLPLLEAALGLEAAVTLVTDHAPEDLPLQVEVQPMRLLQEVCGWSQYAAFDVDRDHLPELWARLGGQDKVRLGGVAQVLIRTPMPCGALGDCGVCTVRTRRGNRLVCKDGPVFDLQLLGVEGS
jgi:hypothetical protein